MQHVFYESCQMRGKRPRAGLTRSVREFDTYQAFAGRVTIKDSPKNRVGARALTLNYLEQPGSAHAAADAHRAYHEFRVAPFSLDQCMTDKPCS